MEIPNPGDRRRAIGRFIMASRFFAPAITFGQTPNTPALIDPYRLLQQGLDSMLTDISRGIGQSDGNGAGDLLAGPRLNVEENDNEIRLTAELPGVSERDVQVTLDGDLLVIAGEKKQEEERDQGNLRIVERAFGRFRRSLRLPFTPDPDGVRARFRDGVLTVEVPKEAEQRKRTKQIPVSREAGGSTAREAEPRQEQAAPAAAPGQEEREPATAD
jgi:HSP20 family protein